MHMDSPCLEDLVERETLLLPAHVGPHDRREWLHHVLGLYYADLPAWHRHEPRPRLESGRGCNDRWPRAHRPHPASLSAAYAWDARARDLRRPLDV